MKTAEEILNQVEPNGELLDTDQAIRAMEEYADQFRKPPVVSPTNDNHEGEIEKKEWDRDSETKGQIKPPPFK